MTTHEILVEAESFAEKGGWVVDQQFVHSMGSPYLLAHGLGKPVANAKTLVSFPEPGIYHVWVRTKNWVPGDWDAPGRFQLVIDGTTLDTIFGTEPGWNWQSGGVIDVTGAELAVELQDLTGFDGRCDAVLFTTDADTVPPNTLAEMKPWRDRLLGRPGTPPAADTFDLVIAGGGIAGCAAALAAEMQGLSVALIHDRPRLGGNTSDEIRVHTLGVYGKGEKILTGLDTVHWPNGDAGAIADTEKRHDTMDAATGVRQFLRWRACAANTDGNRIVSVDAEHIETGETLRFTAPIFIDCTGDGWLGYWAGAEYRYGREGRDEFDEAWEEHDELWSPRKPDSRVMGTSILWNSHETNTASDFPEVPWAMDVAGDKAATAGDWYWEFSANDKHQVGDAEDIRDHMLRAVYGSFFNAKRQPENANVELLWVAYIAGKRESRRLVGDMIYTQNDMVEQRRFDDTVAEETRAIDVHYQRRLTDGAESTYDFMSEALYMKTGEYHIPFRCLYSKNVENLMMAGRCFSCSHIGLGGPRVMLTLGQMGIATGFAASLCKKHTTTPRGVREDHIKELRTLIGYEFCSAPPAN